MILITDGISGDIYSYQWYINGIEITAGTNTNYTYAPANGDSIKCVCIGSSCNSSDTVGSNTIYMVVTAVMVPTITVAAPPSAPIGATVTVNATVMGAGSSYSLNWYDNAVLFNTTTVPFVTYLKSAVTDVIRVTVVPGSEGGCYDSTTSTAISVTVLNAEINNVVAQQIHIYPNPVSDVVHVDGCGGCYKIMSILGAELLQGTLVQGSNNINVSGFAPGIYLLEVRNKDDEKTVTKIIKE